METCMMRVLVAVRIGHGSPCVQLGDATGENPWQRCWHFCDTGGAAGGFPLSVPRFMASGDASYG
ncbi:hypothetical protein CHLRE_17g727326v5 [Chlamydomonas reinhardtii]|uniref:Uncharacterized protein n=1 Tax=Chlamydomonas reinhardtii TaxID=3055 RepID=A0A2K3CQQ2_CHLRE|nr:uncharacterized protein CHLRE_17g727326v5 [Chlamydomonas reinhardtii]PNW70618.1 hypothetical protein CHLRE_17g727326v5 [Chlamydomonas reinhardtii]